MDAPRPWLRGAVLRELAESLDIKLGNLQYYFATRDALVLHVLGVEGTHDADLVEEQREAGEPIDAFRIVVRDMAQRYRGDSGRLLSMIASLAQHHGSFRGPISPQLRQLLPAV